MKKILLPGLALFVLGAVLNIVGLHVLRSPEERHRAGLPRFQVGGHGEHLITLEQESLDSHFEIVELRARLDSAESTAAWPLDVVVVQQKKCGDTLMIHTRKSSGGVTRVTNEHRIRARLRFELPKESALVDKIATVVVDGAVLYPTAVPGGGGFIEKHAKFTQRVEVLLVATATEAAAPTSVVASLGAILLLFGALVIVVALIIALVRSLGISGESTQPKFRDVSELQFAISQGGRFVCFHYAVSVVVMTFRRGSEVYNLPPGGSAFYPGFKWTALSLVAGWWGIPWGPIYTIAAVVRNFRGIDVTNAVVAEMAPARGPLPPPVPAYALGQAKLPPPLPPPPVGPGSEPPTLPR